MNAGLTKDGRQGIAHQYGDDFDNCIFIMIIINEKNVHFTLSFSNTNRDSLHWSCYDHNNKTRTFGSSSCGGRRKTIDYGSIGSMGTGSTVAFLVQMPLSWILCFFSSLDSN
jgi:hypothetical protein